jgi:endonuclease-3
VSVVKKSVKVKKEAVVKMEGGEGEEAMKEEVLAVEILEVLAEDAEEKVPDIEDIGRVPRKRTLRKR